MKSFPLYIVCLLLLVMAGTQLVTAQTTFPQSNLNRIYFDSADPTSQLVQPATGTTLLWPPGTSLYFGWQGADLIASDNEIFVSETVCGGCPPGDHQFTVAVPKSTSQASTNLLNLFFYFIQTGAGSDYGLLQFATITQTDLDNPNALKVQSNHVQIESGKVFKMDYVENGDCETIDFQFTVTW